jgi:UDP-N-acetylglucosamine 2-epimerase (non-hydrolysing)
MTRAPAATAMVHVLIGTRAQLIKMAPVLHALEKQRLPVNLVLTGQHRVTMQELLDDFDIRTRPRELMAGPEIGGVGQMLVWMCRSLWRLLVRRRHWLPPSTRAVMLVHGDTVSTLLGALAGWLLRVPVAHVESGLRSFRWFHPFPEELTRLLVFRLASVAYCPGGWAMENLRVHRRLRRVDTGANTLLDAVRWALERAPPAAPGEPYFVASIHRFENLVSRERLDAILAALLSLTARARCKFVLHPVTESRLRRIGALAALAGHPRIELLPRMPYTGFVRLLAAAEFVVTDGGSNQEELSYLGIPTVLMRDATERREGIGQNVLLNTYDVASINAFLDRVRAPARSSLVTESMPSPSDLIARDVASILAASP